MLKFIAFKAGKQKENTVHFLNSLLTVLDLIWILVLNLKFDTSCLGAISPNINKVSLINKCSLIESYFLNFYSLSLSFSLSNGCSLGPFDNMFLKYIFWRTCVSLATSLFSETVKTKSMKPSSSNKNNFINSNSLVSVITDQFNPPLFSSSWSISSSNGKFEQKVFTRNQDQVFMIYGVSLMNRVRLLTGW